MTQADSFNPVWMSRERLILLEIQQQIFADMWQMRHARYSAAAAVRPEFDTKGEYHKAYVEMADDAYRQYGELMLPYLEWDKEKQLRTTVEKAQQDWSTAFGGDPDDPELQKKIQATIQDLTNRQREAAATARKVATRQAEQSRQFDNTRQSLNSRWKKGNDSRLKRAKV